MHVRDFFTDLLEREVIDAMWGEHAPPDLEAMLVMEIGGRSDMVLAIPLGAAEAARWHAPPTPVSSPLSDRTMDSANFFLGAGSIFSRWRRPESRLGDVDMCRYAHYQDLGLAFRVTSYQYIQVSS